MFAVSTITSNVNDKLRSRIITSKIEKCRRIWNRKSSLRIILLLSFIENDNDDSMSTNKNDKASHG